MDEALTDGWDDSYVSLLADDFTAPVRVSDEEFFSWLEVNPCPIEEPASEVVEVAPRRRRQEFLEGITLLKLDEQALQVERIKWIAAEAATYARQAANPIQENIQDRVFIAEVALTLGLTEYSAQALIARSNILTTDRRATLAAVVAGLITLRHAEFIADEGAGLTGELGRRFERAALIMAEGMTPAKLKNELGKLRERLQPDDSAERHADALADRQVRIAPNRDGMGELWAALSGEDTAAIDAKLDACVRSIQNAGGEDDRTSAQLRADVLVDLLLNDEAGVRNVKATVFVTVPADTAVGGDQPGEVMGQGPMDAQTMRNLMTLSSYFFRVLIHPETGNILEVGTDARHIPTALRRWVANRDGTCRFPGCNRTAIGLDLDHVEEFAKSQRTTADNLISLCRKHHKLRHLGNWTAILLADGDLIWTSPSGRVDVTHPANPVTVPKPTPIRRTDPTSKPDVPPLWVGSVWVEPPNSDTYTRFIGPQRF